MPSTPFPDGVDDAHAAPPRGLQRIPNVLSLLVLGALMALALSGMLAGDRSSRLEASSADAVLAVTVPERLRNGEFFEMRIEIAARRDIADLQLAIPPTLWRDMTINTMIPAAEGERFAGGAFRFGYGALKAGDRLVVKIDGQINPPLTLGTEGSVAIADGDRPLAAVAIAIAVLP